MALCEGNSPITDPLGKEYTGHRLSKESIALALAWCDCNFLKFARHNVLNNIIPGANLTNMD